MNIRYVIYDPATGDIRTVMTGSLALAEANLRPGLSLLQYPRYVSAATHRVEGGVVTRK